MVEPPALGRTAVHSQGGGRKLVYKLILLTKVTFLVEVMGSDDLNTLLSVDFEVFGQVQGCFFTKHCKDLALQLGITGWVKNTKKGTIVGKLQGRKLELDQMIDWLCHTGSSGCKIEKCELANWVYLTRVDYKDFSIRF